MEDQGTATEQALKLLDVFQPRTTPHRLSAQGEARRFVHYTSAEAAYAILKGGSMWLRSASAMNDFQEVRYGNRLLDEIVGHGQWLELMSEIDRIHDGFGSGLAIDIARLRSDTESNRVWLTSLSEHYDHEDELGRLSMWRAYGGNAGVALVVNGSLFFNTSPAMKCVTGPVDYLEEAQFADTAERLAGGLLSSMSILSSLSRDELWNRFMTVALTTICFTKHPGFREEKEWRLVHCPRIVTSDLVPSDIQCIRGVPQLVHTIPLISSDEFNFEASPASLIDRLILGPSRHPEMMKDAFEHLLNSLGVPDAAHRVVNSRIPLRD